MLYKESWVHVSDSTNIRWIKIFHLYKGFHRKVTTQSYFVKGSARVVESPRVEYKGFKYKFNIKGDISRLMIVRDKKNNLYLDGSCTSINYNSAITIKKKSNPRSKFLFGPIPRTLKRKKFMSLYTYVI
jgi:ribosomal protein L14